MPGAPKANAQSEINAGSSLFNATSLACVRALPFSALKIQGYRKFFKWLLSLGPHEGLLKAGASCDAMLTPRAKYPGPVNWAAFVVIGERDWPVYEKTPRGAVWASPAERKRPHNTLFSTDYCDYQASEEEGPSRLRLQPTSRQARSNAPYQARLTRNLQ